jgi:hypothetical protein
MVDQHAADRDRLIANPLDAMAVEAGLAPVLEIARRYGSTPDGAHADASA